MPKEKGHGEGAIRERRTKAGKKYFEGAIQVGTDPMGKRRMFYCTGRTKAEVRDKFATALNEERQGVLVLGPQPDLATYLEYWCEYIVKPSREITSYASYKRQLRLHVIPALGRLPLGRLTPQQLQKLYADKLAAGLSPRSVQYTHGVLRCALNDALRQGLVGRNVADLVDPPKVTPKEMRALSPDEARRFVRALRDDPMEAYYILSITTGLRPSELVALRWEDIDWEGGRLTVRRKLTRLSGLGVVEGATKTRASRRPVRLYDLTLDALWRHQERQATQREQAGDRWEEHNLVFASAKGTPVSPQNLLRRSFIPLLQRAGLPRIRPYDLRHSTASLLLFLGVNPKVVQEVLGHSSVRLTLDTYSHTLPSLHDDGLAKLDALLRLDSGLFRMLPTPGKVSISEVGKDDPETAKDEAE